MNPTKVILVDNNKYFRIGLRDVLLQFENVEIVAELTSGEEFLDTINTIEADLVFLDIQMSGIDGITAARQAMKTHPSLKIIAFSSFENIEYIEGMYNAGAKGYLSKFRDNYKVIEEIIMNPNGECFFSEEIKSIINKNPLKFKVMEKKKILIVDDDVDVITILQTILEKEHYEVFTANDKNEGLEKARTLKPDLAILDVMMTTHYEGFEMAKELALDKAFKNMPVLIQSSIDVLKTNNSNVQGMAHEFRKDPSYKELQVLLIQEEFNGAAGIDYRAENGKSIWLPIDGFIKKPVDAAVILPEIRKHLK
ncbi:MAG: response regulator [Saprospiraceae bacterium]|nr:response regulator [Saprospiraceae bacterium]